MISHTNKEEEDKGDQRTPVKEMLENNVDSMSLTTAGGRQSQQQKTQSWMVKSGVGCGYVLLEMTSVSQVSQ